MIATTSPGKLRSFLTGDNTLKPTTLLSMFNTPQLEGVAQDVEDGPEMVGAHADQGVQFPCGTGLSGLGDKRCGWQAGELLDLAGDRGRQAYRNKP